MALNRREKVMLTFPVLLGGVLSFYNWVHEPLFTRKTEIETRYQQVQMDLKKDRTKLTKEGDLEARRVAAVAEEQTIDSWVPGKNSAALLIWSLSQAELHSGGRIRGITIGEPKQVTPTTPDATGEGKTESKAGPGTNTPFPSLTVVRIELKLDGRFAEHLLFAQEMEQAPLFLDTDAITLTRYDPVGADQVQTLLAEGSRFSAEQILGASPVVGGSYQFNLYFKGPKAGPATNAMRFGEGTGRTDPFVMDGVSEFVQSLQEFYSNKDRQPSATDTGVRPPPPADRGSRSGQLG